MENNNAVQEKRRFKRVDARFAVEYRDLKKANDLPRGTMLRNLSEGGVCFNSKEFMSLACRLVLNISLPDDPKPVKAISKVAWIRKMPSSDQYELGNQFLEIAKEDRAHIADFVNRVSNQNVL